jgi:hypothetical protein
VTNSFLNRPSSKISSSVTHSAKYLWLVAGGNLDRHDGRRIRSLRLHWRRLSWGYLVDVAGDLAAQTVNVDRLNDIAEALLTAVVEGEGRVAANLHRKACR